MGWTGALKGVLGDMHCTYRKYIIPNVGGA
jgi:hypothetical protein